MKPAFEMKKGLVAFLLGLGLALLAVVAQVSALLNEFPITAVLVGAGAAADGIAVAAAVRASSFRVLGSGGNGRTDPKKCASNVARGREVSEERPSARSRNAPAAPASRRRACRCRDFGLF